MKSKKYFSIFIIHLSYMAVLVAWLLTGCARMGTPDGGPYDETPPRVVHTSPRYGAANEKDVKRIVIEFDEIVKVENAMEKVVISPPQIEQPEIEAMGRRVTITLLDSLKPDMTYTIDFSDAIVDNNEGNPYGDYAFTFSTGENVDTFQVSGHVLNASNLEPIKGILVGLYKVDDQQGDLPDSVFRTIPFERISRTDGSGHFVVKGLAKGNYRAFALKDQNQNYIYDQPAEMVAFSSRILTTSSQPDIRPDTIWHDSIYYDSIVMTPYTHYYPDDVILTAFESAQQNRYMLKSERPILQQFTIYFTAPSDTLPKLTGLNFDAHDAFVVDASQHNDTLHYWIKDSLIYNLDTLEMQIDFFETDTAGNLVLAVDTLRLVSKLTKAKLAKQEQERFEEWAEEYRQKVKRERRAAEKAEKEAAAAADNGEEDESGKDKKDSKKKKSKDDDGIIIPPMPEEFLEYRVSNMQGMAPDKNVDFTFSEPLDSVDLSKIRFSMKVDTVFVPARYIFRQVPGKIKTYRLYAEWEPDSVYQIELDTAAFVNIYGSRNEARKFGVKIGSLDTYSTLFVILQDADTSAIVQLLDGSEKVVKSIKVTDGKADFYFIAPGTYYLRLFNDANGNGKWDTGDYDTHLQPEQVYYYPDPIVLKAQWEITQEWNPASLPLSKQKPAKITKQRPERERVRRNRNAEREKNKNK
ncbi:MAG: Ig-like domain-containing protein [Bacteroidaceae bacterium]|nr:Ig-like domain-containing protein [Bacteroidaceae bacterium]